MDKNDDDNFKVNVVGADDQKLRLLGELLRNETSRKIIRYLMEHETYLNELAKKLDLQPNLVIHHLNKLKDAKLVTITKKKIIRKGVERNYYNMNPYFFVAPNKTMDEIKEKGILKRIFKEGVKFASIGIIAFLTFNIKIKKEIDTTADQFASNEYIIMSDNSDPLILSLVVIIIGISIIYFLEKRKR